MLNNPTTKKAIIALLVFLAGFFLYSYFFSGGEKDGEQVLAVESGGGSAGREFIMTLAELNSINFDTTIFSSEVYRALEDQGVFVKEEPRGRDNPFAPLSGSRSGR